MIFINVELAQWLLMKANDFCAVYFLTGPSLSLSARGSVEGPQSNSVLPFLLTPLMFYW